MRRAAYFFSIFFSFSAHAFDCRISSNDPRGIPHIQVGDLTEAMACLGYVHARDRAFQMDDLRMLAQGRGSERIGAQGIKTDFTMRIVGIAEKARALYAELAPEVREIFDAYAKGVNAGFAAPSDSGRYLFEAYSAGQPEPWEAWHSLAILLLQSFDQTRKTFETQISEERTKSYAQDSTSPTIPWQTSILKPGEYLKGVSRDNDHAGSRADQGSNNWVLAPSRSQSGKALLANDPHLHLKHPGFWYWVHLHSPENDWAGITLPGAPLMAAGFSRKLAWGLTNSYFQVSRIELRPKNEPRDRFRPWVWFRLFWKLKLPFFFKTYDRTKENDPVLPLPTEWLPPDQVAVLHWSALALQAKDFLGFLGLYQARSAKEMDRALAQIGLPSWNFVFADARGEIGFRTIGLGLKNEKPWPLGLARENEHLEFLSPDEMPHLLSPKRGFIATANNLHWGKDSKYTGGRAYAVSLRAHRIEEMLLAQPKHDFESLKRIQCDLERQDARYLLPLLLPLIGDKAKRVKNWYEPASLDCESCALFRRWMEVLQAKVLVSETGIFEELSQDHSRFTKEVVESFDIAWRDIGKKPWGVAHRAYFPYLPEAEPPGLTASSRLSIPTPGDDYTVNVGTSDFFINNYDHVSGPSARLIVEMTNPPRARIAMTGENRDDPKTNLEQGSWKAWRDCEYTELGLEHDFSNAREIHF